MNRNKFIFLFVLLLSCLLVFSSCNKKDSEGDNKSVASTIISSDSKSSREPVVVVPSPDKTEKAEETSSQSGVETAAVEEVKIEETAVVVEEEAPLKEESATVTTTLTSQEGDDYIYTADFSYKGITSSITASKDCALITIPQGVTSSDLTTAIALLVDAYPELKDYVVYDLSDDAVLLSYPSVDKSVVEEYLDTLFKEAEYYINYVFASLENAKKDNGGYDEKELIAVALTSPEEETDTTVKEEVSAPVKVEAEPLEKTEEKSSPYTLSFSLFGGYDFGGNKITGGAKLSFDYELIKKLSLSANVAAGYGKDGFYLPLSVAVKYNFIDNFYGTLGVGYTLNFKNKNNSSLLVTAGIGYYYSLTESLALNVEAGAMYYPLLSNKVVPALTLGVKYNF